MVSEDAQGFDESAKEINARGAICKAANTDGECKLASGAADTGRICE